MKTITIDIAEKTVEYFKDIDETTGIPYQTIIGMYLTDCMENNGRINVSWVRDEKNKRFAGETYAD
ncbi:MAG: antitoxin [Clostridia bacterium]|nr:antitoxin [Clostridia bacterium]